MSSSNLPLDLVEEILLRVPTQSLTQFRTVCKQWNALFNDKVFINRHLILHPHEHFMSWKPSQFYSVAINPSLGIKKLNLKESRLSDDVRYMVHCDGLLLCATFSKKLAVWNPCLSQLRWIKPRNFYRFKDFYGFGYSNDKSVDGYKILRFYHGGYGRVTMHPEAEIFEFKTNTWRVLDVAMDWYVELACHGVSLMGNSYWIASFEQTDETFIQSFDFSEQTFQPLCQLPFEYTVFNTVVLAAFRGDRLSVINQCETTNKIEIWVTNKIGSAGTVCWSKFLEVALPSTPALHLGQYNSFPCYFIDKNNKLIAFCEVEFEVDGDSEEVVEEGMVRRSVLVIGEDEVKQVEIDWRNVYTLTPYIIGYVYVPSLVPVHHTGSEKPRIESSVRREKDEAAVSKQ